MDDAVSGREQPAYPTISTDPGKKLVEERLMLERLAGRPMPLGQKVPYRVNDAEMRGHTDTVDLAFADERQVAGRTSLKKREFDA